mgnify:CR=1 FL=1
MSQKMYNLTDNVEDGFRFDIRGKVFFMKYPNTEEIEELQKMADKSKSSSEDGSVSVEDSQKAQEYMYQFITPVDHETHIRDAIKHENLKVLQRFNNMVKAEFSVGD